MSEDLSPNKKRLVGGFFALLLFLCLPETTKADQMLSTKDRISLVQTWYQTMNYDLLADELDWRHAPGFFGGEILTSRDQVEKQLAPFYFQVFDNISVEIDRIEASEASVFSFGTYVLTPKNSSKVTRAPFLHVWRVNEEGRLAGLVQYADTLLINDALRSGRVLLR
ncbi:hypothetical protein ABVF61_30845 [Roseibium sp. HPY-6]|uniref:nuclear transport factor 2 family protein n=1 Tax=Roseibium sp. HPY-6 TaxID=3229852 RepID=UPI00338D61DD